MVSNIISLYPQYRANARPDAQLPAFNPLAAYPAADQALNNDIEAVRKIWNGLNKAGGQINDLDKKTGNALDITEKALFAGGMIPTFRRLNTTPKDLSEGNWERAAAMGALTAMSLPGDVREMHFAGKDLLNIFKPNKNKFTMGRNVYKNKFQHGLSFFKGTFMEGFVEKKYPWLMKMDKTLYDTNFGRFVRRAFNVNQVSETRGIGYIFRNTAGQKVPALKFTGSIGQKLTGRALLRVPVIGLVLSAALEIPAIIKSAGVEGSFADKTKSVTKQVCKSAAFLGLVQGGLAYGGAAALMLFPAAGAFVALAGMAIGSAAGVMASKALNKEIDKAFA